jgi:hypothetical protein
MFTGAGKRPNKDVARIEALPGVKVIDKSTSNIVIVEAAASVKKAVAALPNWVAGKETRIDVPKTGPFF